MRCVLMGTHSRQEGVIVSHLYTRRILHINEIRLVISSEGPQAMTALHDSSTQENSLYARVQEVEKHYIY